MPQPVTTTELLLAQVVDRLGEIRDLLQDGRPSPTTSQTAGASSEQPIREPQTPAHTGSGQTPAPRRRTSSSRRPAGGK